MKSVFNSLILLPVLFLFSCAQMADNREASDLNQKGVNEMGQGQIEKAILSFREALKHPNLLPQLKGTIYHNLSKAFEYQGEPDSSIKYLEKAISSYDPESNERLLASAELSIVKGNVKEGLMQLNKVFLKDSSQMAVNNTLGLIYLGDYGEEFMDAGKAVYYNRKAFLIQKDRTTKDVFARALYFAGDYAASEKLYTELQKEYPREGIYACNLGMAMYQLGKEKEAEEMFKLALSRDSSLREEIDNFRTPEVETAELSEDQGY